MQPAADVEIQSIHKGYRSTRDTFEDSFEDHTYTYDTKDIMSGSGSHDVFTAGTKRAVKIEVTPPKRVQKGTKMYPPLVLSVKAPVNENITFRVFAKDENGSIENPWNGAYYAQGNCMVATGEYLRDGGQRQYAVFSDIEFNVARNYTLYIDVMADDGYSQWTADIKDDPKPEIKVSVHAQQTDRGCKFQNTCHKSTISTSY